MIKKTQRLPVTELAIMAAVEQMAQEMVANQGDDADLSETTLLDFYAGSYMESLSEAGYTETRPWDRLSMRAFARLIRVKAEDLATVKGMISYDGEVYRDFALADIVLSALSRDAELAPALALLAPGDAKPVGPYYPTADKFDIAVVLRARADHADYLKSMVEAHKAAATTLTDVDNAVVKLAGVFNLSGLTRTTKDLVTAGATNDQALKVTLAYVVLDTLRTTPRFATGLRCVEPHKATTQE